MESLSYESSLLSMAFEAEAKDDCCLQTYRGVHANEGKEPFKDTMHLKNKHWCQNPFTVENKVFSCQDSEILGPSSNGRTWESNLLHFWRELDNTVPAGAKGSTQWLRRFLVLLSEQKKKEEEILLNLGDMLLNVS